ncbi:hypothetical protein [uncultured Aquimarina sp.]|uniref:hypothetical protein n=1 Tax=uncultured Aquimarina sp. TaxID=575652 RepID=UPI0026325DE2|nr:hypothetical protein [uncultured Aquimarina sp.]
MSDSFSKRSDIIILKTMSINITFINKSYDKNNSQVVIFLRNVAIDYEEIAVAWHVIRNCGVNWTHDFIYPTEFDVGVIDSYRNVSDRLPASYGQKWDVEYSDSGDILQLDPIKTSNYTDVQIKNDLAVGSIDAEIYRGGKLAAIKKGVSPGEKAVFEFEPYIYVGVNSQIKEGDAVKSAIISDENTRISLQGITNANLIMTGGGTGINATPFRFELEPIL